MPSLQASIEQTTKDRISMARMLCVLGMIFVHVPDGVPGTAGYSFDTSNLGFLLEAFLVEGPGRASAALLSMVSGFLVAVSLQRAGTPVTTLYKKRFVSIILPMIFWGLVTYAVYGLVSQTRPTFLADAVTWLDKLNIVLFLTELPQGATMHLGFLRDLFVCVLLSPLLLFLVRRFAWLLLVPLAAFYLLDNHATSGLIIFRPLVLFAFTLGLLIADRRWPIDLWDRYFPLFLALAVVSTTLLIQADGGAFSGLTNAFAQQNLDFSETVLYPLSRLFGSLAIWTCIPYLIGTRFSNWLLQFTPYLFAAYCSHYLVLTLLFFGAWLPLFGDRDSGLFVIWFLAAPAIALMMAVVLVRCAVYVAPPMATLITGGRIRSPAKSEAASDAKKHRGVQTLITYWTMLLQSADASFTWLAQNVRAFLTQSRRWLLGRR